MDYGEQDEYGQDGKLKRKSAKGRKLIRWNPDLDQLVLLCVDHVCTKQGIAIPWDDVATMVAPHLTGEAIKQHLVKIYKFRQEDGHSVPPKLDRTQRRKAFAPVVTPAPARGRGKKGGERMDDNDEPQPPVTPVKPGRTLLFKKPEPKSKRAPKKDAGPPKTLVASGGRKKAQPEMNSVLVKSEDESDGDFGRQSVKPTPRGAKRGRKTKKVNDSDEDDDDTIYDTPSKKAKMGNSYLRSRQNVDYAKQMAQDEDDTEIDDDSIALKSDVKNEQRSSQGSGNDFQAPPPQFGLSTPAHTGNYQVYPPASTSPGYDYSNGATPFESSPVEDENGVSNFRNFDNYGPPPMMPMPNGNGFNHAVNGMMPFLGNGNVDFGVGSAYGNRGFPFGEAANALNTFSQGQGGNYPMHFGSTANHSVGGNMYDHNNGVLNSSEDDNKDNIVVNGMLDGTSDKSADYSTTNAIDRGLHSITPHDAGGGLHLGTGFGANSYHQDHPIINTSPTAFADGETGITPDMAQTGFQPHFPVHNDSFDSGLGSSQDMPKFELHSADDFFGTGLNDDVLSMGGY
ncbi:hypothetical protein LTR85_000626 [Meristemomyces frigidus]|nr:hypothetical protein LTR85_000626 [Meristemomyces frigidus]